MQQNLIVFNKFLVDEQSMTADFTTTPQDISNIRSYSVQGKYSNVSAASTDMVEIQGSSEPDDDDMWTTVATFTTDDTSGTFLLNVELPAYTHVRTKFTHVAAVAGDMTIKMTGKV